MPRTIKPSPRGGPPLQETGLSEARAAAGRVISKAGVAPGLSGKASESSRLADDLSKHSSEDTWAHSQFVPLIRAAVSFNSDKAAQAVDALTPASPYELGNINPNFSLTPEYLRGLAYLRLKQGPSAAAEIPEDWSITPQS
jgi:hypothetical protein